MVLVVVEKEILEISLGGPLEDKNYINNYIQDEIVDNIIKNYISAARDPLQQVFLAGGPRRAEEEVTSVVVVNLVVEIEKWR